LHYGTFDPRRLRDDYVPIGERDTFEVEPMERWATVKRLHQAALDRQPDARAAFLDQACSGDEALRREVESLLAYQAAAEPFLESPALEVAAQSADDQPSMPLVGQTLGHYQVQSLLGRGGMGEVYLARDPRLDRAVALKILPPDLALDMDRMSRFSREAKAASALNHPNVATIHDIGESHGVRFIVMEYVEGHTLAEEIADGPLPAADAIEIGVQVADALDAAHAKGITHRDIKPANLMRTPRGQVKVLDFGIAKTTQSDGSSPIAETTNIGAQTAVGVVIGSVPYMSPEQVLGRAVDHRSDIFSLGVAMYETATGRPPFASTTPAETMDRILHVRPEPICRINPEVPVALERVIGKCLEKEVERRYQFARDLLADLRALKCDADTHLPSRDVRRHNLPAQLTSFIGRTEIAEIRRLLSATRLLTLTGAGGCGKTRLALHVAEGALDIFRDGVWLIDLGPLSEPALISHTTAAVIGLRGGPDHSLEEALAEYFRTRRVLLLLDNCEHLIAGCAQLVEPLLRAAPGLHVLATSREGLGVAGETVWRVPSMSVPTTSTRVGRDDLLRCEAGRLFAERAAAATPGFTITDGNAVAVAEICRRLDGIPLAIELAAARLNVLSVDQLGVRLRERFRLLTGGSRTAVARQRTLEATIDWSYELLSESERTLLCRLSVFPGGWTLDAAEEVCAGNSLEKESILDLLSHLVDKSLVNVEDDASSERRYRCLETVRQYGRERLVRSGDAERMWDRHLDFFFALVRRAEPQLLSPGQVAWLDRLQGEYANLRAAIEWCLETPRHAITGLEFAAALLWFWSKRGYVGEGRQWLDRALEAGSGASPELRAKALNGVGHLTTFQLDCEAGRIALRESLDLAREAGDNAAVAWSLGLQALLAFLSGDVASIPALAAECQAAAIVSEERWLQFPALECLAYKGILEGEYDRARELLEEALELGRRKGDTWIIGLALSDLAFVRVLAGHYAQAEALCAEGILLFHELEDCYGVACILVSLAGARAARGSTVPALRLWGAMQGLLHSIGSLLWPSYQELIGDRFVNPIRESLGEEAFHTALSEGRAMSLTQAVKYALAEASCEDAFKR
jgi:non-specific serine/threonine protein kinase